MDMQDKEFDDIFRSKLDGFEADPSGKVWAGIDQELGSANRRRIFLPILRIAASVVIMVTAGILFIPRKGNVKPAVSTKNAIVKSVAPVIKKPGVTAAVKQAEQVTTVQYQPLVKKIIHLTTKTRTDDQAIAAQKQPVVNPTPETVKPVEQSQVIAAVQIQKPAEITQPVVPGIETPLVVKQTGINGTPGQQTNPALIAQQRTPVSKPAATAVKKHGIHNFGDIVNMVVAKVDKRKEKAIEFTDTDDDESFITAVNIGPVKINKDEK